MKQRLEMGYILPGQMNELFGYKEIMGRLENIPAVRFPHWISKPAD